MPTALRGHVLHSSAVGHGHAKPWPWHPSFFDCLAKHFLPCPGTNFFRAALVLSLKPGGSGFTNLLRGGGRELVTFPMRL